MTFKIPLSRFLIQECSVQKAERLLFPDHKLQFSLGKSLLRRAWIVDENGEEKNCRPIGMTVFCCDHRIVDGALCLEILTEIKKYENFEIL